MRTTRQYWQTREDQSADRSLWRGRIHQTTAYIETGRLLHEAEKQHRSKEHVGKEPRTSLTSTRNLLWPTHPISADLESGSCITSSLPILADVIRVPRDWLWLKDQMTFDYITINRSLWTFNNAHQTSRTTDDRLIHNQHVNEEQVVRLWNTTYISGSDLMSWDSLLQTTLVRNLSIRLYSISLGGSMSF